MCDIILCFTPFITGQSEGHLPSASSSPAAAAAVSSPAQLRQAGPVQDNNPATRKEQQGEKKIHKTNYPPPAQRREREREREKQRIKVWEIHEGVTERRKGGSEGGRENEGGREGE